jgi:hypothetical protein
MVGFASIGFGLLFMIGGAAIFPLLYSLQNNPTTAFFYAAVPFVAGLALFIWGLKGHEVNS